MINLIIAWIPWTCAQDIAFQVNVNNVATISTNKVNLHPVLYVIIALSWIASLQVV